MGGTGWEKTSMMKRRTNGEKSKRMNRLMDEVYRQMLLLEVKRPGAEMGLALALLRAWVAADSRMDRGWSWLRDICPVCLEMIEDSLNQGSTMVPWLAQVCGSKPAT